MKKIFLVTTLLSLPLFVNAAQIRWNEVQLYIYAENEQGYCMEWSGNYVTPNFMFQVFCDFNSGAWGYNWSITPIGADAPAGNGGLIMYEAEVGSIVNNDTAHRATQFVNVQGYMNASDAVEPWTTLTGSDPRELYLAIALTDQNGRETFGWVELRVSGYNGEGHILAWNSALDLDGGPMIVGGGSATPEPSSGLLLLVGGALLALRRRVGHGHGALACLRAAAGYDMLHSLSLLCPGERMTAG